MSEEKFSPGTAVEIILGDDDSPDIWYPATVIKENGNNSFMVKYKGSNEAGDLTVSVDSLHIRPSPPACANTAFQLLEKVDAFCNFGWSSGVVTKVLSEGRYIVYFKRTKKEKELRHTDLRLPMVEVHGEWVHSSQDDAVISNPEENEKINHGDDGKNSVLPEESVVIKENKEVRKVQQERAKKSRKACGAVFVRQIKDEVVTNNGLLDRCNELKSVLDEVQPSLNEHETHMTPAEQLDQPEMPEQSENGNAAHANSASPGTRETIRGEEKPRRSDSGNSEAEVTTEKNPDADSLEYTQKPIVISLPYYNNSEWNKLQTPNTIKLPMPDQTDVQMEKKQLPSDMADGVIVNDVNHGNSEVEGLKKEGSTPKRKRGRPFGSLSRGKRKVDATVEMLSFSSKSTRRSSRERRENVQSVGDTPKPTEKKLRPTDEILSSTQQNQANPDEQVEGDTPQPTEKKLRPTDEILSSTQQDQANPDEQVEGDTPNPTEKKLGLTDEILSSTQENQANPDEQVEGDTPKPTEKKLRPTDEILSSTQENQANPDEQAEGVLTYRTSEYDEPISHVSPNGSDEDMPVSTWLEEVPIFPCTKLNPGGNASISGKVDVKVGQVSSVQFNKETTIGNNVDVAQNPQIASQQCSTDVQIDEENMIDVVVNVLPFVKTSPIWEVIESMEVFQKIPQNPHFQPLYATKDHCREGLAVCSMVTFSRVAEDVSKFQFDDPSNALEDSIETLSELEKQGFNVELIRSRLNALLSIKRQHESSQALAKEIKEEEKVRARIHEELDDIDKKMAELREKRALTFLEWQKRDSKIGGLQMRFSDVKEALEAGHNEFETIAAAPWSS